MVKISFSVGIVAVISTVAMAGLAAPVNPVQDAVAAVNPQLALAQDVKQQLARITHPNVLNKRQQGGIQLGNQVEQIIEGVKSNVNGLLAPATLGVYKAVGDLENTLKAVLGPQAGAQISQVLSLIQSKLYTAVLVPVTDSVNGLVNKVEGELKTVLNSVGSGNLLGNVVGDVTGLLAPVLADVTKILNSLAADGDALIKSLEGSVTNLVAEVVAELKKTGGLVETDLAKVAGQAKAVLQQDVVGPVKAKVTEVVNHGAQL